MSGMAMARVAEKAGAAKASASSSGLRLGDVDDQAEHEADSIAEKVMSQNGARLQWRFSDLSMSPTVRRKCDCGGMPGEECEDCKAKKLVQRKAEAGAKSVAPPPIVDTALRSSARPLMHSERSFFEQRFAADFGSVRIHSDAIADQSARAIGARAYTVGDHIVFKQGAYDPEGSSGRRLMAHELAHVVQQSPMILRRAPDAATLKDFDERVEKLKALDAFKKLDATAKGEALEIIKIVRARDDAIDNIGRLEILFATPKEDPKVQAKKQEAVIDAAAQKNTERLATDQKAGRSREKIEEGKSAEPARKFHKATGQDGTTFLIDDHDLTDIALKVKLQLVAKSKTPQVEAAVEKMKSLEDAIEKRASTWGYSVDIDFVEKPGPDVFSVPVDTGAWATSGNLVGGSATLAHELHHLLGLDEDRYDYRNHAKNKGMPIGERVHWFLQEFRKKVSNNPKSIMDHNWRSPLDDDVCRVAGKRSQTDLDACVKQRADARAKIIAPPLATAAKQATDASDIFGNDAKLTSWSRTVAHRYTVAGAASKHHKDPHRPGGDRVEAENAPSHGPFAACQHPACFVAHRGLRRRLADRLRKERAGSAVPAIL